MALLAIRNYELYNKIPQGTATVQQVQATSFGVEGYANWVPPNSLNQQQIDQNQISQNQVA